MSYRTSINGIQIFGNDDVVEEWEEALKKQGCVISEDGFYEFEVKDFMPLLEAVESYVERKEKESLQNGEKSLFDITYLKKSPYKLNDTLNQFLENSYLMLPYQLIKACKEHLDVEFVCRKSRLYDYRIKEGHKIIASAG